MMKRLWSIADKVLLVAVAYFVTGRLGLMLPAFGSIITLIWLPSGIAVAALRRWGYACWPAVTFAAFAVNFTIGTPWPAALAIGVGNTLGPLLAAWALKRIDFHSAFERKRDIVLLAAAGMLGMLVTASWGVMTLALSGLLPHGRLAAWLIWWAGDTMGVIAATPLVLTFTRREWRSLLLRGEFVIWAGTTALVVWGVFVFNGGQHEHAWSLAFVPLPLVAWAALRFGAIGTSLALIVLAVGAAYGAATGRGPLFRPDPIEGVVGLWVFMATAAVLGWLITALHVARLRATGIQRLLEQALSDVSLGVLLGDLDRLITYANAGFTRLTGYSEAELLGKSCRILQGPETDPATVEKLRSALHGDGFFDGEILNYRKDGTTFWNGLLISPVRNERAEMTGFLAIQRDITKRKETELALQLSEEHLRTIVELEPECVKILSPDGRLLEMNPAGLAMIEAATFDEVRGCPLSDLIVPEDRSAFTAMHQRVLRGEISRCEVSIIGLKGTRRWAETHAVPYRNARREIIGVLGITRDITQRKEAAAELERSLSTLQLFINSVPAYISFVDAEERYRLVNRGYETYFGIPADRIVGQRLRDVQPPAAYAEMEPFIRKALSGQEVHYESHPTGPDGRTYWLDVHYFPRRENTGVVSGFFVMVHDITQLRQAEVAQQEALNRLQKIASQVPGVVYQFRLRPDGSSCFPFASDAIREIYRVSPEEVREDAAKVFSILHPDDYDGIVASIQESARTLTPWRHEFRVKFGDGTVRWLFGNSLPQREADGSTLWHGFITDITDRKQAEIERELLDRKMQDTQKLESLGVLAGGIAHDFNNILTAILGNASLALYDVPPGSPVYESLEQISGAAVRAADLCKQMLAYSGKGRFVVRKIDLGELISETTQMLQISISKKAVLRFHLAKDLPPVEVDATQIRQVIMNLVINASEAIGERSGVISLTTGLAHVDRAYLSGTMMAPEMAEGDYVFLEVSDNGCGMTAETQAKIFDPFFTTKFTGRGLGLAAVLGIMRGHKGALKVYSEPGRGTTFKLLFPVASGASEASPVGGAAVPEWRAQGTVLVVDDEETIRNTVTRMLCSLGLEPVLASDGREAVEIFRADPGRFRLVLLDLTMPHMDGEQTFAELRRLRADVRVVLMSGFNQQEALVRFTGKGLASFLQKPFTIDMLRATLQAALG